MQKKKKDMKGRQTNRGDSSHSADLLVCFPTRTHLALVPKQFFSPARHTEPNNHRRSHHHHRRPISKLAGISRQASPQLWEKTNNKQISSEISEPTSPKVTCAGQIKVQPRSIRPCKTWQSVMEEIERIHNSRKNRKEQSSWVKSFGFKKDVLHFLRCLRNTRFDSRSSGSFPRSDTISDHNGNGEEEEEERDEMGIKNETSRTIFSRWLMVLQDQDLSNNGVNKNGLSSKVGKREKNRRSFDFGNIQYDDESVPEPQRNSLQLMRYSSAPESWLEEKTDENNKEGEDENKKEQKEDDEEEEEEESVFVPVVPPRNALLLMRSSSAPECRLVEKADDENKRESDNEKKNDQKNDEEEEDELKMDDKKKKKKKKKDLRTLMEEENTKQKESLVVIRYGTEFHKVSEDIAKETWIVGGVKDQFSTSRSCKMRSFP